jgi:hypothetical protein
MHDEYENEPIPGLPAHLPEGETLLWQGAPRWTAVMRDVFHVRLVAIYFAILMGWRLFEAAWTGDDMRTAVLSALWLALVAAAAIGVIAILARLTAKTTMYSITSRRVVMRYGIALPITVNLPFKAITAANLKMNRDGTGDIALALTGNGKLGYVHLWPHARPWHLKATQPMLRALADPSAVANTLSKALRDASPESSRTPVSAAAVSATADSTTHLTPSSAAAIGAA